MESDLWCLQGIAAVGAVVAFVPAYCDNRNYKSKLIRPSFKPVPLDRTHPDQLWIGACAGVAAFWMLSLYAVLRDIWWPQPPTADDEILRWMARIILVIMSVAGLTLYTRRPKKNQPAQ
ncbi:MAG TPA: hypothetical protein VJP02_01025 [Candidatus Sulfotelmatobacter sp.]|nr:hypothetical protein [Candidatus Sulfotelmatobacter sp.]